MDLPIRFADQGSRAKGASVLTVALLVTGYAGYYLCRSDFSVALPLMIRDLGDRGISQGVATARFGAIASLGVLAYAIGKFPSGWLADYFGGKRNFLGGMAGSVLFTLLFAAAGGIPIFTLAWIGNRAVQSLGWAGAVKITSKWFAFSAYGTVMGIISLSYLFGDAASRQLMSTLIAHGVGWRGVFGWAAAILGTLFVINVVLLRESPSAVGLTEPPVNPDNLFGEAGEDPHPANFRTFLATFGRSPTFWLVCLLSLGVTLLRETFNLWTPTYFTQALGLSAADAAQKSALFPLFGGISVLGAGYLSDKLGRRGRATIVFYGLLLTALTLFALAAVSAGPKNVWIIALVAFLMIGPYSYFAGAMSLDFGGRQGSATASGFIDGVGYFGGVLAGSGMASVAIAWGWRGAFAVLAVIALLASLAAGIYLARQSR
jgi:sugar phosphate permease